MLNRFVLCLAAGVALSVGLAFPTFAQTTLPRRPTEQPPPDAVPGLVDIGGVSGREESHLPALVEPGMNLAAHPAPIVQPSGSTPSFQ